MAKLIVLNPEEKIILSARRHWYALWRGLAGFFGLAVLPVVIYFVTLYFQPVLLEDYFYRIWGFIFFYLFALFSFVLKFWLDYYLDQWVVTNQRVFDIEQKGLFSREVSIFNIAQIQNASVDIQGPLATFLDFGDVHVQTAGEGREFVFWQVPHPNEIQKQLIELNRQNLTKNF